MEKNKILVVGSLGEALAARTVERIIARSPEAEIIVIEDTKTIQEIIEEQKSFKYSAPPKFTEPLELKPFNDPVFVKDGRARRRDRRKKDRK